MPIAERTSTRPETGALPLRSRLVGRSVSIGIPAYNEGPGIVHTLESVLKASRPLGLGDIPIILSDSSETSATVDAARAWATAANALLIVDRSETRRSEKEARNVLMARASSDILIQIDADVIVPASSLANLLFCLTEPPAPFVAVGIAAPDPAFNNRNHRAGAWQLNAIRRYASWLPSDAVRAEGAYWGAWRAFYADYRLPIGSDSPHADVCLARHLESYGVRARNCWRAVVYKVPPGTLRDFYLQTQRWYAASGPRTRSLKEIAAAALEAVGDPFGAALYARGRLWARREERRHRTEWREAWDVTHSTKRQ